MKRNFFFKAMCAVTALAMAASCTKDSPVDNNNSDNGGEEGGNETPTYTLIAAPQAVSFGWNAPAAQSVTVTTNAPDGFTVGTPASWYTAVVSGSKVIITAQTNEGDARSHELLITANGANEVKILVKQDEKGEVHASLQGQKYIVWQIDQTSAEFLGDKIIMNLGENGTTCFLDIWTAGETLVGDESATGPGFYGYQTGYVAFQVGNAGWSGGGYRIADEAESDDDPATVGVLAPIWQRILDDKGEGWFFHAAIKGTKGAGNSFRLCDVDPDAASSYWLRWDDYDFNASDWTEVEIPMTTIVNNGWTGARLNYTLTVHGGGTAGQKLHYDALFIYKK